MTSKVTEIGGTSVGYNKQMLKNGFAAGRRGRYIVLYSDDIRDVSTGIPNSRVEQSIQLASET